MAIQNAICNQYLRTTDTPAFVNVFEGFTTTATAAGTTTLVATSTKQQEFTGVTTQTVTMPVTSTLVAGQQFYIINNSTGAVTVESSGANTIQVMDAGTSLLLTCVSTSGTTAASWQSAYITDAGVATPGATGTILRSNGTAWVASTSTFADTYGASTLLYSNGANTVTGLATANNAILVTSAAGVPSISSTIPSGLTVSSSGDSVFNIASTSATGAPFIQFFRDTSTSIGFIQAGTDNAGSGTGDGLLFANAIAAGPLYFYVGGTGTVQTINSTNITSTVQYIAPSFAPNTTSGIIGTTTNDSAAAGSVGEFVTSNISSGAPVAITSGGVGESLTSISLTAGDWDVFGVVVFGGAAGTNFTQMYAQISSGSAAFGDASSQISQQYPAGMVPGVNNTIGMALPTTRISIASTTSIFCTVQATFTVSTAYVIGRLSARRVR